MCEINKHYYPCRLDTLLTKDHYRMVQDEFMKFLKSNDSVEEAIRKFQENRLLPILVGFKALSECKNIDDFYFFLLIKKDATL